MYEWFVILFLRGISFLFVRNCMGGFFLKYETSIFTSIPPVPHKSTSMICFKMELVIYFIAKRKITMFGLDVTSFLFCRNIRISKTAPKTLIVPEIFKKNCWLIKNNQYIKQWNDASMTYRGSWLAAISIFFFSIIFSLWVSHLC